MKKTVCSLMALALSLSILTGCGAQTTQTNPTTPESSNQTSSSTEPTHYENEVSIALSDDGILVDGQAITGEHAAAVYMANDIVYYEDRDTYDSGNAYGEGTDADKHSAEEAAAHTVVHITQPGVYRLSGTLSQGQIAVDLGEDAKRDPNATVTLLFDGVDITCTVAPAVIFYQVYECDTNWVAYHEEESEHYSANSMQDTSAAGANVIVTDGSVNNIHGSYVARIYKDNSEEKKLHKYDGAFYSKMSMNVMGETNNTGILNIYAANEGLNSELHLTINGGNIHIQSDNDGINTNEDGVSVTTVNGGSLHIVAGLGEEGDGVDSNGYLVINGGVVIALAKPIADSGLDSDLGSYINGGWVLATGSTMEWAESDSNQVTMNLQFAASQDEDEAIIVTDMEGTVVFAYDPDQDETTGSENRAYQGAILSCPNFVVGETYHVYVGGDVSGTEENGLYDVSTVTGFEGAVRQQYTGTDVGRGGPGGRPMGGPRPAGNRPDGDMKPEGMPEPPAGIEPGQMPEGFEPPEGFQPPEEMEPDDMTEDTRPRRGQRPDAPAKEGQGQNPQSASVDFYLNDNVNAFSGISDVINSTKTV